jgi:DNA-binding transcriptional regulator/RsmH inhibitor MraZ
MALAKIDSKGRVSLPREIHEMLGDMVELKAIGKQRVLLSGVRKGSIEKKRKKKDNFAALLDTEPRRIGKPENPTPEEMKSIWNE